jgi:tetratricopeptide (TPR) repeat protein
MSVLPQLEIAERALWRGDALAAHAELLSIWKQASGAEAFRALRLLAVAAQRLGRFKEAGRWLDRAEPLAPDAGARAELALARVADALALGDREEALALNQRLEPVDDPLEARRGALLASFGEAPAALESFMRAGAKVEEARLHLSMGKLDEAARALEADTSAEGRLLLGDVRFEQERFAEAEACYRAVAGEAPEEAMLRLAALHAQLGKFVEAVAEYQELISLLPSDDVAVPTLMDELASVQAASGRVEEAVATLENAVSLVATALPADPLLEAQLRSELGTWLLSKAEIDVRAVYQLQLATQLLESAGEGRSSSAAKVLNNLALAHLKAGALDAAEAAAERSLTLEESPLALNTLALVRQSRGDEKGARQRWEQARDLH